MPLFYSRPLDVAPTLQCVGILLSRPALGPLWREVQMAKDLQHMMRMIVHLELPLDSLSNAFSGPQIGREAGGSRPLQEDAHERLLSLLGQLGRSSGDRLCRQSFEAVALNDLSPSPHRRWRRIQRSTHIDVSLALQKKTARDQTTSLLLSLASERSCCLHVLPYAVTCKSVHYFCDSQ